MIGQWTTERSPATTGGPVVWICADDLHPTLRRVVGGGGVVQGRPWLDNGERWLAEVDDPAGNRIGIVVPVRAAQPQPMLAVRDVEASSRWYQQLLGLQSDHGGPEYERLLADGVLVLQLHHREVEHHHGRIGDPEREVGNGVLLWFGDVADFDEAVARAQRWPRPSCGHRTATHPRARATAPDTASCGSRTPTATPSSSPAPTARRTSRDRAGSYGFTRLLAARIIWVTV